MNWDQVLLHYSVAPVIGNRTGLKAYTFNYSTQGTGCHVKSFIAQLSNTSVLLDMEPGTAFRI